MMQLLFHLTHLHRNNTKLIFFVDPGQESFFLVVVDTSTFWPVSFHTSGNQVFVSRDEQEMVINQLLANGFFHAKKWVVGTSKISLELGKGVDHQFLDSKTLFFGDSGRQTESFDGASDTNSEIELTVYQIELDHCSIIKYYDRILLLNNDEFAIVPSRFDWCIWINISLDFINIHVRLMLEAWLKSMIFKDQRIKYISEIFIGILITSIDTAVLIIELNSACNSLN